MPEKLSITAQVPEKKDKATGKITSPQLGPVTIAVDTGKTATEMIQMFGDEAVKTNAMANWVVTVQGNIRSALKRGESQEQIQGSLGTSKMGVAAKGARVDPVQAYLAQFQSATPGKQKEMLADLQRRAASSQPPK